MTYFLWYSGKLVATRVGFLVVIRLAMVNFDLNFEWENTALNRFASSLTATTTPLDSVDGSVDERPYHLRISLQDVHRPIDERGQQVQMEVRGFFRGSPVTAAAVARPPI